ncbi:CU044_5270 family protein [Cellulomonas sp. KRMCY2]|uniref:CU044_5270 family protein n=1 Tax=Cellulomonas sp. KRMCY2 TaxID=1304865 RepID=UPI00045E6527|nr:CU044_5270 family protein [Cellulomonas sp. KRMCY2]
MSADRGESEVAALRALMAAHDLLPPVPDDPGDGERASRLLRRVLTTSTDRQHRPPVGWAAVLVLLLVVGSGYAFVASTPSATASTPPSLRYSLASPVNLVEAASASEALAAIAAATEAATTATHTADVQYVAQYGWLLAVDVDHTSTTVGVHPTLTRRWTAPDGSARVDQTRAPALDLDGRLSTDAPASVPGVSSDVAGPGTEDAALPQQLPLDRAALRATLLARYDALPCGQSAAWTTQCLLTAVQDLYAQYVVPPELRASLWLVLADDPGVKDLGSTEDRFGRPAHAVAVQTTDDPRSSGVVVLLISPTTGDLLGTENITLRDEQMGITNPTVTAFTTFTTSTWVDAVGERPEGGDDD